MHGVDGGGAQLYCNSSYDFFLHSISLLLLLKKMGIMPIYWEANVTLTTCTASELPLLSAVQAGKNWVYEILEPMTVVQWWELGLFQVWASGLHSASAWFLSLRIHWPGTSPCPQARSIRRVKAVCQEQRVLVGSTFFFLNLFLSFLLNHSKFCTCALVCTHLNGRDGS